MPGKGQDLTANDQDCFSRPFAWFENCNRELLCWRTWQRCLLEGWTEFLGRWPRSGLMLNGIVYRLPPLVRRISGTGFLFSPTAKANQLCPSMQKWPSCKRAMWATPTAHDGKHGPRSEKSAAKRGSRCLQREAKMYPTPTAHNAKEGGYPAEHERNTPTLAAVAGGQLNPQWVSWLMGFPVDWCDLPEESQPESQTESTNCDALETP